MSDQSPPGRRKSFVEMLAPRSASSSAISTQPNAAAAPSQPIPTHRRGMSVALGLTGTSATSTSPFDAFARQRRASISTSTASGSPEFRNSFEENAVIEEDDFAKSPVNSPPSPSFGRRLSFGAQALRDVKQQGNSVGSGGGRRPSSSLFTLNENPDQDPDTARRSPGTGKAIGEGFNWSEAMRDKTKRTPSMSGNPFTSSFGRPRATSTTSPEPPKEMPKISSPPQTPLAKMKKPDHLGERMLRGDFMMD